MISIFAKLPFLNIHPNTPYSGQRRGKLMRISSLIRCQQIAEHIGARVNPTRDYENDVCVYVKPGRLFNDKFVERAFIDVLDDRHADWTLKEHPLFVGIACSKRDKQFLSRRLKNKIMFIPQHHCNFERVHNEVREFTRAGMIGSVNLMPFFPGTLKDELAKRHIELFNFTSMYSREDVTDFYQSIDLQIIWRPYQTWLSNPLKIVNAASFGVPTIALREDGFIEAKEIYLAADNEQTFVDHLDRLIKNQALRQDQSARCIEFAENYHIDKIGELYKSLCTI